MRPTAAEYIGEQIDQILDEICRHLNADPAVIVGEANIEQHLGRILEILVGGDPATRRRMARLARDARLRTPRIWHAAARERMLQARTVVAVISRRIILAAAEEERKGRLRAAQGRRAERLVGP